MGFIWSYHLYTIEDPISSGNRTQLLCYQTGCLKPNGLRLVRVKVRLILNHVKQFIIFLFALCLTQTISAQTHRKDIVSLNEIYTDPGTGFHEFIELYNSSLKDVDLDDYTVLLHYANSSTDYGFYVIDLPQINVTRDSFYVLASASPFDVQANTPRTANFNWSTVLNATSGDAYLRRYHFNNSSPTKYDLITVTAAEVNNILVPRSGAGGQYHVIVFDESDLVNFFVGGDNALPSYVNSWADLTVPFFKSGTTRPDKVLKFSTLQASNFESVVSNTGSNNGYKRRADGQCASWEKSSSGSEHTPGSTNGVMNVTFQRLTIDVTLSQAASNVNALNLAYRVSGTSDPTVWPITVRVVNDYSGGDDNSATTTIDERMLPEGPFIAYNNVDVEEATNPGISNTGAPDSKFTYPIPLIQQVQTQAVSYFTGPIYTTNLYTANHIGPKVIRAFHVFFTCNSGCIDQIYYARTTETPVLPVEFKSFTAKRSNEQVHLNWQTVSEQSNLGFNIERNTNGQWIEIGFVPSRANGGSSDGQLTYQYMDVNDHKSISQYRIRQTDLNDKTTYSAVRSVQGLGGASKLVIYPNPSFDGRVQVVFEDGNQTRHLVITDMGGRIVRQFNNVSGSSLVVDGLTPGLYTARVIDRATGDGIIQKFVVQQK